jgi:hypothetical protein
MRFGDGCVAQLVEQLTLNQRVQGSNPCTPTNLFKIIEIQNGTAGLAYRRAEPLSAGNSIAILNHSSLCRFPVSHAF